MSKKIYMYQKQECLKKNIYNNKKLRKEKCKDHYKIKNKTTIDDSKSCT